MNTQPTLISRLIAISACALSALISSRAVADEKTELLVPGATVEISGSHGKFDFLEIDPQHRRLLASHEADGTADFIDLKTNQLITRVKTGAAMDMAFDPKGDKYFVSVSEEKLVAVVDAKTLKQTGSIALEGPADGNLFDPKNRKLYVAHDDGMELWVIDADSEKIVGKVEIPGAPEYMVYDAKADRIYLNIKVTDEVVVIDPSTNKVIGHWSTLPAKKPHGLAFDADTGRLFSVGANGELVAIDITTGKIVANVKVANKVDQAAFDPSSKRIYCSSSESGLSIAQETTDGLKFLGNVKTSPGAKDVAIDPETHAVWVTFTDGKSAYAKSWKLP